MTSSRFFIPEQENHTHTHTKERDGSRKFTPFPVFPSFCVNANQNTTSIRWTKWIHKLENLFITLDINNNRKQKAMHLHYTGDEVFDIYHNFADQKKTTRVTTVSEDRITISNEYKTTKKSLSDHFTPQKTRNTKVKNP